MDENERKAPGVSQTPGAFDSLDPTSLR